MLLAASQRGLDRQAGADPARAGAAAVDAFLDMLHVEKAVHLQRLDHFGGPRTRRANQRNRPPLVALRSPADLLQKGLQRLLHGNRDGIGGNARALPLLGRAHIDEQEASLRRPLARDPRSYDGGFGAEFD